MSCSHFFSSRFFKQHAEPDFARAGFIPKETIVIPEGKVDMAFSLEPRLRQLGMPTLLKDGSPRFLFSNQIFLVIICAAGVIRVLSNHTVCKEGEALSPEQARLLVPVPSPC